MSVGEIFDAQFLTLLQPLGEPVKKKSVENSTLGYDPPPSSDGKKCGNFSIKKKHGLKCLKC